jgi:Kef-type K+ transport system membrane component KefB
MELGLSKTRTAALTIGAAAVNDAVGWIVLGVVSTLIGARLDPTAVVGRLGLVVTYGVVVLVVLRPVLVRLVRASMARAKGLDANLLSWMCVLLFASAIVTSKLGVFAILGGFVLGLALQTEHDFATAWKSRVMPLVQAFFLPLFFAYTGLRTEIGSLSGGTAWLECGLVCLVGFVGKFGGTYLAARALGEDHRTATTLGVCMNTRGLLELVVLNVGYDMGVLPKRTFTMLVVMAIVSTFVATPAIRRLMAADRALPEGEPST